MSVPDYKINYKSDFVLTINGDAGWAIPFCIKFWTGMPSQAYFVGFDGVKYVNCRVGDTPTQLLVMFDDHHLPIGPLRIQIAYHTTIEEFPGSVFDEVTNARDVIVTIDGTDYQVMLDFTGEDAPELEFDLPAYANEAERIQNELQRQQNEADRIEAELQREQATAAAVQGAENVNAQIAGNILTVTNRQGVSTSVNTKGEQGEQGPVGPQGPQGEQGETGISIVSFTPKSETSTTLIYTVTFSDGHTQDVPIPKGAKGDTGATGPQGQKGDTGVSIVSFTQTGSTTESLIYTVTFSDSTTQQVAIPKGAKGDTGPQGPVGPQGPQGPMGDVAVITPEQQAAFTMYSVPGQNTNGPMTQKAVTDVLVAEYISYDNSQNGLASNNVQGAIDEQETELTIEDSILSNLYAGNGCINYSANPDAWLVSTKYYGGFIQISRYAGGKLYVKAGSTASAIAFLKETPITAGNMTSNYATGETTVHEISANNDIILSIPSDAVFLYVNMYSNRTDMRPAIIKAIRSVKSSVQNIEEKEKIGVIRQFAINNNNAKMSVCTTACDFELGKSYRITARISPTKTHYVGIYLGNEATAGATAITLMVVGANTNTLSVIYTPTDLSWKYFKNYQDVKGTEFISITVEELSKVEQLELQVDDSYEAVTKTTTWTATSGSSSNPSISVDIPANSVIDVNLTGPTNSSYVIGINYEDGTQERHATQYAYDTRFYASKKIVLIWAYTSSNSENFSGTMTAVYSRTSDSSYVLADESYKMSTYRNFESPVFYAEKTITSNVPYYASDDGMAGFYQAAYFTERVDIPIGVYDIARSIPLIKTNQTIQGDGWSYPNDPNGVIPSTRGSLIRLGSNTICGFKFSGNVFNGNMIRDIGFSGTDTNGNTTGYFDASNPSYNAGIVINANRNDQMFIHKVSFRGLAAGISIYDNARIDACTFDGLNTDGCNIGIYFRPTATYFAFLRNSIIADCPACGLYVSKSERSGSDRITFLRVENNVFVRNCGEMTSEQVSALGIKASVVLNTADSCTILNNVFNQSGTHADPTAGTTVTDADTIGLYISGNNNLVTGNYFGTTSGGDTLHVVGSNNLVSNNILENNATVGGSGTRFINNSFTSNSYTLKVTGSNCHISNNCCTNYIVSGNNNVINAAYYSGASVTVASGATGNTLIGFESANITNNGSGTVIK